MGQSGDGGKDVEGEGMAGQRLDIRCITTSFWPMEKQMSVNQNVFNLIWILFGCETLEMTNLIWIEIQVQRETRTDLIISNSQ